MRDYGRVYCGFWASQNIRVLSEDGRTLALYLLTSPHTTIVGAFRLPDGYVSEDLQWSPERVRKGFDELLGNGFANRCETTKWAWICKFLEWNPPENPNQWKAARKIAAQIPDECCWKLEFMRVFACSAGDPAPPESNPSRTVTQTVSKPGTGTVVGAGEEDLHTGTARAREPELAQGFAKFKASYPPFAGRQNWIVAEANYRTRLEHGSTVEELQNAVERYAAYVAAGGVSSTAHVLRPDTFLSASDEPWRSAWDPPTPIAAPLTSRAAIPARPTRYEQLVGRDEVVIVDGP